MPCVGILFAMRQRAHATHAAGPIIYDVICQEGRLALLQAVAGRSAAAGPLVNGQSMCSSRFLQMQPWAGNTAEPMETGEREKTCLVFSAAQFPRAHK